MQSPAAPAALWNQKSSWESRSAMQPGHSARGCPGKRVWEPPTLASMMTLLVAAWCSLELPWCQHQHQAPSVLTVGKQRSSSSFSSSSSAP